MYIRNARAVEYRKNNCVLLFKPVVFMNLGSDESLALIAKYAIDQEKIVDFFVNANFLNVVLEQIHTDTPICID